MIIIKYAVYIMQKKIIYIYIDSLMISLLLNLRLGSMSSLDSNSQVSDSRPSSPLSEKRPSEALSQVKHEAVLSSDPVEFKKSRTENK